MKTYKVYFDIDAEEDLFNIFRYVALNDSVDRADKLFQSLRNACYKLRTSPMRVNISPEMLEIGVTDFREVHHKPYCIIYSIEANTVYIHCIIDGRRDIQTILQERLLR
jgi:toxin ParE1/3/4